MKNRFEIQAIVGLGLVVVAIIILVAVNMPAPQSVSSPEKVSSARSKEAQATVNRHLEMTANQIDMDQRRAQVETSGVKLPNGPGSPGYSNSPEGSELNQEHNSEQMANDLGVDKKVPANSPMDMIQQQIFQEEQAKQMDEEAKREYARQFVENARRGGYDVILSDDYHVLSVKPIK